MPFWGAPQALGLHPVLVEHCHPIQARKFNESSARALLDLPQCAKCLEECPRGRDLGHHGAARVGFIIFLCLLSNKNL